MYKFVEKVMPQAKILAAAFVAFFPIFVQHSAFATPDIVLTFLVLLISYISFLYLRNPTMKYLIFMCVATGIGITVKYTCAIACLYIAFVVYLENVRKDKTFPFLKVGLFCSPIVISVCLLCAPNLFIHIDNTFITLCHEARSTHLGADGLGFFGNFSTIYPRFLALQDMEHLFLFWLVPFLSDKKK